MQNLYTFNPDNEMSIANGSFSYTPPANIMKMVKDLGILPVYLASDGDYILVSESIEDDFLKELKEFLPIHIQCYTLNELKEIELNIHNFIPWGWSPRIQYIFNQTVDSRNENNLPLYNVKWTSEERELHSRKMTIVFWENILQLQPNLFNPLTPIKTDDINEIHDLSDKNDIVIKCPWSSSGKGILMIDKGKLLDKEQELIRGYINRQKYVLVERKLDRVLDFALEYEIDTHSNVSYLGISLFTTNKKGEYESNYICSQERMKSIIQRYVSEEYFNIVRELAYKVIERVYIGKYIGFLGIDMIIYRNEWGEYKINPCIEINLRCNMGILSLNLYKKILQPQSTGRFMIHFYKKEGEALQEHLKKKTLYPTIKKAGKVKSGYINLTPVRNDTRFVTEMIVNLGDKDDFSKE